MQGCQKLNVIRPSRTPPKAVRSAHGKWKPKCCILYIFWNKTVLSHCLKVKLKCQHFSTMAWSTSEPLQGPKCTIFAVFLSKVKALRSLFEFYPHAYRVGNIFCIVFWMIFSSNWSLCSALQLAGYYLAAFGHAWKVAQSAVETFWRTFSNQITGIFGNARL